MTSKTLELERFEQLFITNDDGETFVDASHVFIASVDDEFLEYIDVLYSGVTDAHKSQRVTES